MKKNIILTSAILLAGVCFSEADTFKEGLYAGGSLGGAYSSHSAKHTYTSSGGSATSLSGGDPKDVLIGDMGIHLGYLYPVDDTNWVLGLHLFADLNLGSKSTFETKIGATPMTGSLLAPWALGLGAGLRLGYVVDDTWMIYLTSGIHDVMMEYRLLVGDKTVKARWTTFITGFFYGAGIEKQLSNGHRLGLELTHRIYMEKKFSVKTLAGETISSKIKPRTLGLKLSYSVPF